MKLRFKRHNWDSRAMGWNRGERKKKEVKTRVGYTNQKRHNLKNIVKTCSHCQNTMLLPLFEKSTQTERPRGKYAHGSWVLILPPLSPFWMFPDPAGGAQGPLMDCLPEVLTCDDRNNFHFTSNNSQQWSGHLLSIYTSGTFKYGISSTFHNNPVKINNNVFNGRWIWSPGRLSNSSVRTQILNQVGSTHFSFVPPASRSLRSMSPTYMTLALLLVDSNIRVHQGLQISHWSATPVLGILFLFNLFHLIQFIWWLLVSV